MSNSHNSVRYRTIDLIVTVMLGVASGVAFYAFAQLIAVLDPITKGFPPVIGIYAGIWPIPAAIAMLIVRKPGASVAVMVIGAIIEAALGDQFGWTAILSGALVASGFEIMGLATGYRKPPFSWVLAGSFISVIAEWVFEQFVFFPTWAWNFRLLHLVFFLISAVILLAIPSPAIVKALAKTGALSRFPIGHEVAAERR